MEKFYILFLTKDNFLENTITDSFRNNQDIKFIKKINNKEKVDLIIFDNINQKNLLDKLIKKNAGTIIINTSSENLKVNSIGLERPFKIDRLLFLINKNIEVIKNQNKNLIKLNDCDIHINKRDVSQNNIFLDNLTEKEVEILNYLNNNKKVTKGILLNKVWHYNNLTDTKVVESNIYKLRQKFKKHNLQNPILFEDGYYKLNK